MTKEIHRPLAVRKGLIYEIPTRNSGCIPNEILKMIDNEIHKLLREYPCLKGEISEIVFEDIGNDIARASIDRLLNMRLKLHVGIFVNQELFAKVLKYSNDDLTHKDGLYGFLKHELIHMLEYKYCKSQNNDFEEIWNSICDGRYAKEILIEALNICLLPKNDAIIEAKISHLATYNASEAIAEACSSYEDNELTKTIKKIVNKKWR